MTTVTSQYLSISKARLQYPDTDDCRILTVPYLLTLAPIVPLQYPTVYPELPYFFQACSDSRPSKRTKRKSADAKSASPEKNEEEDTPAIDFSDLPAHFLTEVYSRYCGIDR